MSPSGIVRVAVFDRPSGKHSALLHASPLCASLFTASVCRTQPHLAQPEARTRQQQQANCFHSLCSISVSSSLHLSHMSEAFISKNLQSSSTFPTHLALSCATSCSRRPTTLPLPHSPRRLYNNFPRGKRHCPSSLSAVAAAA